MALIKCEDCKKEISDKAVSCPHCGCPVVKKAECEECGHLLEPNDSICSECGCPVDLKVESTPEMKVEDFVLGKKDTKEENGKSNLKTGAKVWLGIGIFACFAVALFYLLAPNFFNLNVSAIMLHSSSNTVIYPIHFLAVLLGITYIYMLKYGNRISYYLMITVNALVVLASINGIGMIFNLFNIVLVAINVVITSLVCFKQLNKNKISKVGIGVLIGLAIASLVLCVCSSSVVYNNTDTSDNVFIDTELDVPNTTTTKYLTPVQKMNKWWTNIKGASCTEEMCMYLFEAAGTQTYYTLDYKKKTYESDFFTSAGETYYKYNYGNNTGYGKMTVIAGYTSATVELNYTYYPNSNQYKYKWTCSIKDCKSIAEDMAESIDKMRVDLLEDCSKAGISIEDLK